MGKLTFEMPALAVRAIAMSAAALALAGCTFGPSLAERMSAYVGRPESALVAQMGVPDKRIAVNGTTYLAYERGRPVYYGGPYFAPYPGWWGGYPFHPMLTPDYVPTYVYQSCTITFAVTKGLVRSFTLRGDDC